jgi:hypothetical protein
MKLLLLILMCLLSGCGPKCEPKSKTVGMWYSTWYATNGVNPNFWTEWNLQYTPTLGRYDSSDTSLIDKHITMLEDAGVDFVILDETNHLYAENGFILERALKFCERLKGRKLKYAIAIGGFQFKSDNDVYNFEIEEVKKLFLDSDLAVNYYYLDGKPLLLSYVNENIPTTDKTYFNIQNMHGQAREGEMGWATPEGSIPHCKVMSIMPGWKNAYGGFVPRLNGDVYQAEWEKIHDTQPEIVVVTSFNDYAEHTAVEPTLEWANKYWDMTVSHIKRYKGK